MPAESHAVRTAAPASLQSAALVPAAGHAAAALPRGGALAAAWSRRVWDGSREGRRGDEGRRRELERAGQTRAPAQLRPRKLAARLPVRRLLCRSAAWPVRPAVAGGRVRGICTEAATWFCRGVPKRLRRGRVCDGVAGRKVPRVPPERVFDWPRRSRAGRHRGTRRGVPAGSCPRMCCSDGVPLARQRRQAPPVPALRRAPGCQRRLPCAPAAARSGPSRVSQPLYGPRLRHWRWSSSVDKELQIHGRELLMPRRRHSRHVPALPRWSRPSSASP